jgi:hypothetical protein
MKYVPIRDMLILRLGNVYHLQLAQTVILLIQLHLSVRLLVKVKDYS